MSPRDSGSESVVFDREIVSEWAENLLQTPLLRRTEEGELQMGVGAQFDRSVDTEPLDRLKVTTYEYDPNLLSFSTVDGKLKLVVTLDSNLIPRKIDNLRKKSGTLAKWTRKISGFLVVLTTASFILQAGYGVSSGSILSQVRMALFWVGLILYLVSDRIALQGITRGKPAAILGCLNCSSVGYTELESDGRTSTSCAQCGGKMVALIQGGIGGVETLGERFEEMLEDEVERLEYLESMEGDEALLGIDKAKADLDLWYEDPSTLALHGLGLILEETEIERAEETNEVNIPKSAIYVEKCWGVRAPDESDLTEFANSLKDYVLAHAVYFRANERDGVSVEDELDTISDLVDEIPAERYVD